MRAYTNISMNLEDNLISDDSSSKNLPWHHGTVTDREPDFNIDPVCHASAYEWSPQPITNV